MPRGEEGVGACVCVCGGGFGGRGGCTGRGKTWDYAKEEWERGKGGERRGGGDEGEERSSRKGGWGNGAMQKSFISTFFTEER